MEKNRVMNLDAVVAASAAIREENARLCAEADELRGRLRESRRVCREARRECAEARAKAARDASYWRQLMLAAVGLTVAAVCMLFTLLLLTAV